MLTYRIDAGTGIVHILGSQDPGPEEVPRLMRTIFADPAYRRSFGFLRDRRGMPALDTPTLRANVDVLRRILGDRASRWAMVVNDPVNFGMMRMAGFLADGSPAEVALFEDVDSAVRWLHERPVGQLTESID